MSASLALEERSSVEAVEADASTNVASFQTITNDRFPRPLLDTSDGRKYFRRWAEDHRAILRRNFRQANFFTYWTP